MPRTEALRRLPDEPLTLRGAGFAIDDAEYAHLVRTVIAEEIGIGRGANFVVERPYLAEIPGFGRRAALSVFRRLVERERGTYWTFLIHADGHTFLGASPERHVSVLNGEVVMNPISGTYRYPAEGPTASGLREFLYDAKERDELLMVVDEELKMMGRVCDGGGRAEGPSLKLMARLAHTEYLIKGHSTRPVQEILRETIPAPTVTGSPLESACETIARYEPGGRGYYSGVAALIGRDERGVSMLDSTILIRTADIDDGGRVRIGVGATLVRHSDPLSEVRETKAKAAGLLGALRGGSGERGAAAADPAQAARSADSHRRRIDALADNPGVRGILAGRNATLAPFWLSRTADGASPGSTLFDGMSLNEATTQTSSAPADRPVRGEVVIIDAEDTFTTMLAHQLTALGLESVVHRWEKFADADAIPEGRGLVVLGPGPGDPRDLEDPKIAAMHRLVGHLIADRRPLLAVCLGHQVLAGHLGLRLARKDQANQGRQLVIDLFGRPRRVGFYNSFAAVADRNELVVPAVGRVEISRDPASHEVHALRGPGFRSAQFHPESVLSGDGFEVLGEMVRDLLPVAAVL